MVTFGSKRIYSISVLSIIILACLACQSKTSEKGQAKPNILFIMGDDHTNKAISCYGGIFAPYAQTKHIDQLASEGMKFTNCFNTNAICSPSRATILTGKYSHKNGVYCLSQVFDSTQQTSATVLKESGYQTAVFGKWHLASTPAGFDDYKVIKKQGRYQDPQFIVKGIDSMITYPGWSTDVIANMTIEFLKERDKDKPFFVMTHFKATHDPWASRPPYDTLFQNEDLPVPDNFYDTYDNRSTAANRTTLRLELMNQGTFPHDRLEDATQMELRYHIYQQYIKSFLRCGRVLDENVGKIISALEEYGLSENTIVIYTADQGHFLGEHGFFSKRFFYEEALRMPLIIRYPKLIEAGSVKDDFVLNLDFAPSIIDLAGIKPPKDMQGRSFQPILAGQTPPDWRKEMYYHYWQHLLHRNVTAHYGIRTPNHKLIYYYGLPLGQTDYPPTKPEWELFNLKKDPNEMHNIYGDSNNKEIIKTLKTKLLELKDTYGDNDNIYPELTKINQKHFW